MNAAAIAAGVVRATLEGSALVLVVAVVTRLVPRMPAAARCALWWLASLRLLLGLGMLPTWHVTLPAHPAAAVLQARDIAARLAPPLTTTVTQAIVPGSVRVAAAPIAALPWRAMGLAALALLWLAGIAVVVIMHVRDARRLTRLWRDATPVESTRVRGWLHHWIGGDAARRVELRASPDVGSPLILAGARPRILVPAQCLDLDDASLRMALAHEVSHVRRGDLGWGLVPALAQCVFWFHPLAHWCASEYAQSREEACDADALRLSEAAPDRYGALLVGFGVDSSRRVYAAASCGSHHVRQLTRRLRMLGSTRSSRLQRVVATGAMIAVGALSLLSVRFVTASADAPLALAIADTPSVPASTHTARTARAARAVAAAHSASRSSSNSFSYSTSDDPGDSFSYGYLHGDGNTMSGSFDTDDTQWLANLKREAHGEDYAWVRIDRETYIIRDKADVDRFKELMRPQVELGEQQGKLGDQQGQLGDRQGELGDQQGKLGDEQGRLGDQLAQLAEAQVQRRLDDAERDRLEQRRDEIQARMQELSRKMSELGRRQSELGEQQSTLGEKQSELGRRQQELDRETRPKVRKLAEEMIRDGRAERVGD